MDELNLKPFDVVFNLPMLTAAAGYFLFVDEPLTYWPVLVLLQGYGVVLSVAWGVLRTRILNKTQSPARRERDLARL